MKKILAFLIALSFVAVFAFLGLNSSTSIISEENRTAVKISESDVLKDLSSKNFNDNFAN